MPAQMVTYALKKGARAKGDRAIRSFLRAIRSKEKGRTQVYEAFRFPNSFQYVHLMVFKDSPAEKAHREAPHTQKFVDALYPMCLNPPVFTRLSRL
ncbi:MAG: hypothetical protein U1C71_00500 [archaeon]|nr:hypothetical protein [archaeon]